LEGTHGSFPGYGSGGRVLKILGHANIKMTERYAKLAKKHIAKTGNNAREIWKLI
jgi:hypothetical protein